MYESFAFELLIYLSGITVAKLIPDVFRQQDLD